MHAQLLLQRNKQLEPARARTTTASIRLVPNS
jgi:hypothetical protein